MLYLENHDHPRIISRYGSEEYWVESGKTLATSYLFQQGTPFLYQGQEIGMQNWRPQSADMYKDVQTVYYYEHSNLKKSQRQRLRKLWRSSRDSARTPVQWSDEDHAGFSEVEPWFYVNSNYPKINVAAQEKDPNSLLNFYRKAIALRKSLKVVRDGRYCEHFRRSKVHYVYSRELEGEKLLVICSFSTKPTKLPAPRGFDLSSAELILTGGGNDPKKLAPYECRVYLWK